MKAAVHRSSQRRSCCARRVVSSAKAIVGRGESWSAVKEWMTG